MLTHIVAVKSKNASFMFKNMRVIRQWGNQCCYERLVGKHLRVLRELKIYCNYGVGKIGVFDNHLEWEFGFFLSETGIAELIQKKQMRFFNRLFHTA